MVKRLTKNKINRKFGLGKDLWNFVFLTKFRSIFIPELNLKKDEKTKNKLKYFKYTLYPGVHGRKRKKLKGFREKILNYDFKNEYKFPFTPQFFNNPNKINLIEPQVYGISRKQQKSLNYSLKFRYKQILRKYYGNLPEKQFQKIIKNNNNLKFLSDFEQRLDIFLMRLNFGQTIFSIKQYIQHGNFLVNRQVVNIPSIKLRPGDLIEVKKNKKSFKLIQDNIIANNSNKLLKTNQNKILNRFTNYIESNIKILSAIYLYTPTIAEINLHGNIINLNKLKKYYL